MYKGGYLELPEEPRPGIDIDPEKLLAMAPKESPAPALTPLRMSIQASYWGTAAFKSGKQSTCHCLLMILFAFELSEIIQHAFRGTRR